MESKDKSGDEGCQTFGRDDTSNSPDVADVSLGSSRDTKINFDALLPEPTAEGKPCIFLELCAGSAKLSAAVRSTGIPVVPIDHKHNRHTPRCKLVQLDLSQPHAWQQLVFLLDNYDVLACHIAPPCGTCSRARGIPMSDGTPGPQPLRSDDEPLGLKGLSYTDQMRVDGANALYAVLGKFVEELHRRHIPWSVENPTNSLLWNLEFFLFAVVHGDWVHCHACAFGSTRKKLTSFLVSEFNLFRSLERFCPGDHEHEPWGYDSNAGTFNTAKEAEYPDGMCRTFADIIQSIVQQRQLNVHDFAAKSTAAAPQTQKRGRRIPQVVPEYLWTKSVLLPTLPAVDSKKCLVHDCGDIPAGCKLLRTEANKGKNGNLHLCVFGCYRSMQQFVEVSKQVWHPYDELKNLPDNMVKVLFWYLTTPPAEITKTRLEHVNRWKLLCRQLQPLETKLHEQMDSAVANVLEGKNILLMRQVAEDIQWPDSSLFDEMIQGFKITGNFSACGVFKPQVNVPDMSVEQLDMNAKFLRPMILGRMKLTEKDELHDELVQVTLNERDKGWLDGPYTTEQVSDMFGKDWLPVRRFGVKQKAKTRPIDDFRENTLNRTFGSVERSELRTMDHVLWMLVILAQYFCFREHMSFLLSDGTRLEGEVHMDWKRMKPAFKCTCVDLQSAYKQLAVSPDEHKRAVVTIWDKQADEPACFISRVLPFGASASVHNFLRVSAFLHAAGLHVGLCWDSYFDDFALLTHECHEKSSLNTALSLFDLFGFKYSEDKLTPFADNTELLGVQIDTGCITDGFVKVHNKQSRVEETVGFLNKMLADKMFYMDELPSKLGKLQFAETQLWGRSGRLALADIRSSTVSGQKQVPIDDRSCAAVELLRTKLSSGKPRTLKVRKKKKPILVYTDGSLEYEQGRPVARIGGVCIATDITQVFGMEVPESLLHAWTEGGEKEHVIGLVEMYGVLVALNTWDHLVSGERLLIFVDNWPVVDALVKGTSGQATWRDMLMVFEKMDERQQTLHWICRVPSSSNPADPPSRGTLETISFLKPFEICDGLCPITNKCLRSDVKEFC